MAAEGEVVSKILGVIDAVSGWTWFALSAAGILVLCLPGQTAGVNLDDLRHSWGGWILAGTILSAAMLAVRLLRSMHRKITDLLGRRRIAKSLAAMDAARERQILEELKTLSGDEWMVLGEFLQANRPFLTGWLYSATHRSLCTRGILEIKGGAQSSDVVYAMPEFVWRELWEHRVKILEGLARTAGRL